MPLLSDTPGFSTLTPDQIGEQIEDLRRQKQGATAIYAIDPHEIFDFCFPELGSAKQSTDIERVADDQIALYEVFFKLQPAPILPKEYAPELDNIIAHFSREASKGFDCIERVKTRIERSDGTGNSGGKEKLETYILNNFNVLLAAVMGMYSSAAERLRSIAARLSQPMPPTEAEALADAFAAYRRSTLTDDIFNLLIKGVHAQDKFDDVRLRASAQIDAVVIDKLISVNEYLIRAHREGRLRKPVLCLYLSSAPRSAKVFHAESVRRILPDLGGAPFNFWRTRAQIFCSIVYGGATFDGAIDCLQQVREVLAHTREMKQMAGQHDSSAPSVIQDSIGRLPKQLDRQRMEAANLGLVSTLGKFKELTEVAERDGKKAALLFLEIYNQKRPDDALEDMRTALRLMVARSEFGSDLSRNVLPATSGRDPNRSVQYIGVRVDITSHSSYAETYRRLVQLYRTPTSREHALRELLGIYNQFMDTDPIQQEPEYELIRCLLYLSFFSEDGDRKTSKLSRLLSAESERYRYEFKHIAGYADRRLGNYREAYETTLECVTHAPQDPRFHQSLGMSLHLWHVKSNGAYGSLDKAVSEIETAIQYYKLSRSDDADLIGTCYNSLAYYLSRSPSDSCFNLTLARAALLQLKVYVTPENWSPMHPEYYHTEANLEFQDVLSARERGEEAIEKLRRALGLIDDAITLAGREQYRVLKIDIENQLKLLESEGTHLA